MYEKIKTVRRFIRAEFLNVFCQYVFETGAHNGVRELLEVLMSIVAGFALPLKPEHRRFCVRALLPLYTTPNLHLYAEELSAVVMLFVEKDFTVGGAVIDCISRHWPACSSTKQLLFVDQIELVLAVTDDPDALGLDKRIFTRVFHKLKKSAAVPQFQVASRVMNFCATHNVLASIEKCGMLPEFFAVMAAQVVHNATRHWNETVQSFAAQTVEAFVELDADLLQNVLDEAHLALLQQHLQGLGSDDEGHH